MAARNRVFNNEEIKELVNKLVDTAGEAMRLLSSAERLVWESMGVEIKFQEPVFDPKKYEDDPLKELREQFALEVGVKVKERREELGMTQAQFAAKLQCTQSEVSKIEAGKRAISVELGNSLAEALGKDYEWILGAKK